MEALSPTNFAQFLRHFAVFIEGNSTAFPFVCCPGPPCFLCYLTGCCFHSFRRRGLLLASGKADFPLCQVLFKVPSVPQVIESLLETYGVGLIIMPVYR